MSRALELAKRSGGLVLMGVKEHAIAFDESGLERFYALAKADALREAAEWFISSQRIDWYGISYVELRRMAEELEKS